jgi:tetratricopeptide (TPR) repeat protein
MVCNIHFNKDALFFHRRTLCITSPWFMRPALFMASHFSHASLSETGLPDAADHALHGTQSKSRNTLREYPITTEAQAQEMWSRLLKHQRVTDAQLLVQYYGLLAHVQSGVDEMRLIWAKWMAGQLKAKEGLRYFKRFSEAQRDSAMAWHFLAAFQWECGLKNQAVASAVRARAAGKGYNFTTPVMELGWAVQAASPLNAQFVNCLWRVVALQCVKPLAFLFGRDSFGLPKHHKLKRIMAAPIVESLQDVHLPPFITSDPIVTASEAQMILSKAQPLAKRPLDVQQVDGLLETGRTAEAATMLEAYLVQHPGDASAHFKLGLLQKDEGTFIKALFNTRRGLNLAPHSAQGYHLLGQILEAMEDGEGAIEAYKTAITFGVEPGWVAQVSRHLARLYDTHQGDAQNAMACMQLASELEPDNLNDLFTMAENYCAAREYAKAADTYRRVLRYQPDNSEIHGFLGYLYWQAGEYQEAEASYLTCLRLSPHNAVALNNLGVLYLDVLNQMDEALNYFHLSCDERADYAMARFNLGRGYSRLGYTSKAQYYFREALHINRSTHELAKDEITTLLQGLE